MNRLVNIQFHMLQKFLTIVPGDVIYYGHSPIGEIANVDYGMVKNATTINQLLQAVIVIESVFNGKACYVLKRNMLAAGYETETLNVSEPVIGSWLLSINYTSNVEYLRSWEIRRLSSN